MIDPDFELEGLDRLTKNFLELGKKDADRIMAKAVIAGGKIVQGAIEECAPVRPLLPSGTALPPGAMKSDVELYLEKGSAGPGESTVSAVVQPGERTAYAAEWVEYGHALVRGGYRHKRKNGTIGGKGKEIGRVPAHPYIRKGFEQSRAEADAKVQEVFLKEMENVDKK